VLADGAYDGEPVYRSIQARQSAPPPTIVIPPRASAVPGAVTDAAESQRDHHVRFIEKNGHAAWRTATGYGRRSLAETAVGRYRGLIGSRLRARTLPTQQGEAALGVEVLNRMIRVAKPASVRIAGSRYTRESLHRFRSVHQRRSDAQFLHADRDPGGSARPVGRPCSTSASSIASMRLRPGPGYRGLQRPRLASHTVL
jgi:hypothetical protein